MAVVLCISVHAVGHSPALVLSVTDAGIMTIHARQSAPSTLRDARCQLPAAITARLSILRNESPARVVLMRENMTVALFGTGNTYCNEHTALAEFSRWLVGRSFALVRACHSVFAPAQRP